MSSKKNRKRKSGPSSSSSIHATTVTTVTCTIDETEQHPIVCSFPGGVPGGGRDNDADVDSVKFLWQGSSIVGKDKACLYSANNKNSNSNSRSSQGRTKLCVGVYDKQTGQLQIHPARVFCLQQQVPDYHATTSNASLTSAASQYQALFADFGSAKKKKVLKSKQANKVQVDSVVGGGAGSIALTKMSDSNKAAMLEQKALVEAAAAASGDTTTSVPYQNESATNASMLQYRQAFLPAYNEAATSPAQVYDAAQIAGPEAWGDISRMVTACWHKDNCIEALTNTTRSSKNEGKQKQHHPWNESVLSLVLKLDISSTNNNPAKKKEVQHKLKCAVLLNDFVGLFAKLGRKRLIPAPDPSKARFFGKPLAIAERFLALFSTQTIDDATGETGYSMGKAKKDSAAVYMLILYAIVCQRGGGGAIMKCDDLKPLADDLKMDTMDCAQLLKQAGFNYKRNGAAISAELKVPLVFPKRSNAGGRGR